MEDLWEHHYKYYDFFQNNLDRYIATLKVHLKELEGYNKILDTGAGSGNLTIELLKKGHQLTAIDSNELSLEILKEKGKGFEERLTIIKSDVQKMTFPNEVFDAASSMWVIPFVEDNKKYFEKVYLSLKNGGKFTISGWAPLNKKMEPLIQNVEKELTKKGILPKYQKEWDHIKISSKNTGDIVNEGPTYKEIIDDLKSVGFREIKLLDENPYREYSYFIVCKK